MVRKGDKMTKEFVFNFPKTRFTKNSFVDQLEHIKSELKELEAAYYNEPIERVGEEAIDLYHSIETMLDILKNKYEIDLDKTAEYVETKNSNRDYYLC